MKYAFEVTDYFMSIMAHETEPEAHVVYATTRCGQGHKVYRVSHYLSWDAAQARWNGLDLMRRAGHTRVGGVEVLYFSVRSSDDPDWPSDEPEYHVLVPSLPGVPDFGYEVV